MTDTSFIESEERQALRKAVASWVANYGHEYYLDKARKHEHTSELWAEAGKLGFGGESARRVRRRRRRHVRTVAGDGGDGRRRLGAAADGGVTGHQRNHHRQVRHRRSEEALVAGHRRRLVDHGVRHHRARRRLQLTQDHHHRASRRQRLDHQGPESLYFWHRPGAGGAGRGPQREAKTGKLRPALFVVPTDAPGFSYTPIEMELVSPERQFQVFLDDVRLPADALVGAEDAAIAQLFAGLNPERIMGAASAVGMGRFALGRAVDYVKTRKVWSTPIGAHQGLAHPLAQCHIEVELAKLMTQKAATLYDHGDDFGAAEAANMAKYAAAEASSRAVDQAVQSMGGNGLTKEYGVAAMMTSARLARIAPISREMVLNFVAQTSLGLPRSY